MTTIDDIARTHLHIRSLSPQNSDALDFHTVSVWQVRDALAAACKAGRDASPIDSIINALAGVLADAGHTAAEAAEAIAQGERNQAIGTILPLEIRTETALTLIRAAIALHRSPVNGGGQ